jgi:hypothetical protein
MALAIHGFGLLAFFGFAAAYRYPGATANAPTPKSHRAPG